ncbi:MAG: hypothetical protein AAFR67_01785, partial [Chloroflexota bacterium]
MGTDIYGWIEVHDYLYPGNWVGVVKVDAPLILNGRNKQMYAFLFSVNAVYEDALAKNRGMPENVSSEFKATQNELAGHSVSWIEWEELSGIKWAERASRNIEGLQEKYIVVDDDFEVILTGGWELIFNLMRTLSIFHGSKNVR